MGMCRLILWQKACSYFQVINQDKIEYNQNAIQFKGKECFLHDNYINGISLYMLFLLLLRIVSGFHYLDNLWHNQLTVQSLGYKNSQCYQTLKIALSQSPIWNECLTLPTSYPIHTILKFQSWEEIKKVYKIKLPSSCLLKNHSIFFGVFRH